LKMPRLRRRLDRRHLLDRFGRNSGERHGQLMRVPIELMHNACTRVSLPASARLRASATRYAAGLSHLAAVFVRPHAEEHRSAIRARKTQQSRSRCDASRSMGPRHVSQVGCCRLAHLRCRSRVNSRSVDRPHPSRRIHASRLTCMDAPQGEGGTEACRSFGICNSPAA